MSLSMWGHTKRCRTSSDVAIAPSGCRKECRLRNTLWRWSQSHVFIWPGPCAVIFEYIRQWREERRTVGYESSEEIHQTHETSKLYDWVGCFVICFGLDVVWIPSGLTRCSRNVVVETANSYLSVFMVRWNSWHLFSTPSPGCRGIPPFTLLTINCWRNLECEVSDTC